MSRLDLPMSFKPFEVITTTDKDKRDRMFEDLRRNGNELERKAVKFSSNEPVLDASGNPLKYMNQTRQIYRSTWSLAYPTA